MLKIILFFMTEFHSRLRNSSRGLINNYTNGALDCIVLELVNASLDSNTWILKSVLKYNEQPCWVDEFTLITGIDK